MGGGDTGRGTGREYSHLSPVVYDCLREAITNRHKYAHATHMDDVILKFGADSLSLYMFDNGKGCLHIEVRGTESAVYAREQSRQGNSPVHIRIREGFQIYICPPYGN